MILDSSAILAIQLRETGSETLLAKILASPKVVVGSPTVLECILAMSTRVGNLDPRTVVLGFLRRLNAEIVEFTPEHMDAAADAFLRYGKGRHPAALNFGDCIAYALASVSGYPLLYTGHDFAKTDVLSA